MAMDQGQEMRAGRFAERMKLTLLSGEEDQRILIRTADVSRPALEMTGRMEFFTPGRVQLIGRNERVILQDLSQERREKVLRDFFALDFPCLIVCRGMEPGPLLLKLAKEAGKPVFGTKLSTSKCIYQVVTNIERLLAPRITVHGVFMDIYGVGILFTGESGIGKSETALELIKRGHRLVSDDAVEFLRVNENRLVGQAPELIRDLMEMRGIGIIDVRAMFGVGAVIDKKSLDLVIRMERWDDSKVYERLGISNEIEQMLGVGIPRLTVPVAPGRNLAIIAEVAARNFRLKAAGYNAADALDRRLEKMRAEQDEAER